MLKHLLYFCLITLSTYTISSCSNTTNNTDASTEKKHKVDTTIIHYVCESNTTIQAEFVNNFETVNIRIQTPSKPLVTFSANQDPAASGARYTGEKYTYWTKGQACIIEKNKKTLYRSCSEVIIIEGMFSYLADANLLEYCDKSQSMPISSESKVYLSLETRYLQLQTNGSPVYAKLKGYVIKQPDEMGDDERLFPHFYVQEILELNKNKSCPD